jgi:hypothetical protein
VDFYPWIVDRGPSSVQGGITAGIVIVVVVITVSLVISSHLVGHRL